MTERHLIPKKIFEHHWLCSIPEIFFYSTDRLTQRGSFSTGDKAYDMELMKAGRRVYLTIPQMCDYYDQGAPITLVEYQDTLELYQLITDHIANWQWVITTQHNFTPPPIEDLERMEALAVAYATSVDIITKGIPPVSEHVRSIRNWTTRAYTLGGDKDAQNDGVLPAPESKRVTTLAWRRNRR